jgi:hypothetical protein
MFKEVKMICERADTERDCNVYPFKMQSRNALVLSLLSTLFLATTIAGADPVRVRYPEGAEADFRLRITAQ